MAKQNKNSGNNNISLINNGGKKGGTYTVGVNANEKISIFVNRDDEFVINAGYTVLYRGKSYADAEKEAKRYLYRNSSYSVVEFIQDGVKTYKIHRNEGVLTIAPVGTVGVFKRLRDAKILVILLEAKERKKSSAGISRTA